ncbi:sensor histidine kinase [Erwinia mallotivora]|uniref:sensor histidine kinase n=1 Tax=Erwinia mallotivora TaxID=69222 RepID=UPI0021C1AA0F|nr:HAMP domain-containing sensor histidine kinase [Erwinia mallotivora]
MKFSKRYLLLSIIMLFSFMAILTVQNFHEIKNQYQSIEPSLDNYSTAEILFLAFERTRTAVYKTENPDAFLNQKAIFDSKLLILKNKSITSPSFYYDDDFLKALNEVIVQSRSLSKSYDQGNTLNGRNLILKKMDEMQPALIDLQQIIYRIQIRNFERVKSIIKDNSIIAEISALACLLLVFMFFALLWLHITRLKITIKSKNIFISAIYHELSGSIQKIQMTSEVIDVRGNPLIAEKYLARISYHSQKLFNQTKEILEFSKIENGNIGVSQTYTFANDLLEESLSLFNESKNNKLISKASNPEKKFFTDRQKIISVIHNLTDNANKNTDNGVISVRLRLAGNYLIIRVKDNGSGFDIRKLKMLYEPFNQGVESHTKQGLGLGLTIVDRYVKALGGSIRAQSSIGKGSVFCVRIPVRFSGSI